MPLPKPLTRKKYHTRAINCEAFLREDGLWDIEATMSDIKEITVKDFKRGRVKAGDAFHDMSLRITIDESFKVQQVCASMEATPFGSCPAILENFKKIEGTKMGTGWIAQCRERVGGVQGCTHLNDLLPIIATTAFQTLWPFKNKADLEQGLNKVKDTCHSWSSDGEIVKQILSDIEHYQSHQG